MHLLARSDILMVFQRRLAMIIVYCLRRVSGRSSTRLWTSPPTWTCAPICHQQSCTPDWPRTGSRAASRVGDRCWRRGRNRTPTPACMSCTLSCATGAICRCSVHALSYGPLWMSYCELYKVCFIPRAWSWEGAEHYGFFGKIALMLPVCPQVPPKPKQCCPQVASCAAAVGGRKHA